MLAILLVALAAVASPAAPETGSAEALIERARRLYADGDVAAAAASFRAAAAAAGGDDELAGAAHNNACVLLIELGDHPAALEECRRALELRRRGGDLRGLARTLNNLGLAHQNLGDYAESERRFREALGINHERGDFEGEAVNLANLGATATLAGRYAAALAHQRAAAALAAEHRDEPWAAEQGRLARINQAVVLEHLGAYREALDLYRGVLDEDGGAALDRRTRAALEVNTGVIYRNLGDPRTALDYFASAEEQYRRLGDVSGLAHAALNVALVRHLNLAAEETAEADYRRALALAEQAGDRPREIEALFYLGRLLLGQGRLDEAEEVFRRSQLASEESGSALGHWSAHEGLGRVAEARGELRPALDNLMEALDLIEDVRADISRGALRASFFGGLRPSYAATVRVLAALHAAEPAAGWDRRALEVVQRAKSRELLEALGSAARPGEPLAAGDLERLAADGPVIELFAGEGVLYRWEIGPRGVRFSERGSSGALAAAVTRVQRALAGGEPAPAGDLAALGEALLGGLEALPADGDGDPAGGDGDEAGALTLRIAPDGRLHYLPFELLPVGGRRLLERAVVSYLPSASAVGWLDARRRLDGREPAFGAIGFGDPELPPESAAGSSPGSLAARYQLGPLPAAAAELALATRAVPGPARIELGAGATEAAFRQAVEGGARLVHLATHTVVDERPGRGSAILLAAGGGDDGLLYPEEVAALTYRAPLTVLASCRTALDRGDEGRAFSSLTGSFLAAGSEAVIATLWEVGDSATAAFMEQLYYEIGRGAAPAEALARAKRRLAADPRWSDPSLWAGYVLVGETAPPAPRRPWLGLALVAAAMLALLAAASSVRLRRRSSPTAASATASRQASR